MVFGIILIFVGVIFLSLSNTYELVHRASEVASKQNADEVSAIFSAGENISIGFSPGDDWSPKGGLIEDGGVLLTLNVTLISPDNGKTIFMLYFNASQEPPPSPDLPWPIYLSRVDVLLVDEDSFRVNQPLTPEWIGGVVKQDGTFTVKSDRHPLLNTPPRYLALRRVVVEKRYPFSNLLPIGFLLGIFGIVSSLWSLKFGKRRTKRKLRV